LSAGDAEPSRPRAAWVALPAAAALTLGLLQISLSPSVARDGVAFLRYARYFHSHLFVRDAGPVRGLAEAVRESEQHPAYPLSIAVVHRIARPDEVRVAGPEMELAARLIALTGFVALVFAVYGTGRELFDPGVGLVSAWIVALLPEFVHTGSDALSDQPGLALMMLSLWAGVRYLRTAGRAALVGCGVAGGLAYLVRPEFLQPVIPVGAWIAWRAVTGLGAPRRTALLDLVILGHVAAFYVVPLIAAKGSLETKPKWGLEVADAGRVVEPLTDVPATLLGAVEPPTSGWNLERLRIGARRWVSHWWQNLRFVWPLALYLGVWVSRRTFADRPERLVPWMLVLLQFVLLVGWVHDRYEYIAARHLLPTVAVTVFWIPLGLRAAAGWIASVARALHARQTRVYANRKWNRLLAWHMRFKPTAGNIGAALLVTGSLICAARAAVISNTEKLGHRQAGEWIRESGALRRGRRIVDPFGLAAFYARADAANVGYHDALFARPELLANELADAAAERKPVVRIVADDQYLRRVRPHGMPAQVDTPPGRTPAGSWRIREIASFATAAGDTSDRRVRVYEAVPVGQANRP